MKMSKREGKPEPIKVVEEKGKGVFSLPFLGEKQLFFSHSTRLTNALSHALPSWRRGFIGVEMQNVHKTTSSDVDLHYVTAVDSTLAKASEEGPNRSKADYAAEQNTEDVPTPTSITSPVETASQPDPTKRKADIVISTL
jgi:hypothetical protein